MIIEIGLRCSLTIILCVCIAALGGLIPVILHYSLNPRSDT